jgi:hypothetical protein
MPNREEIPMTYVMKNLTAREVVERFGTQPPMKQPIIEWLVDRELKAIEKIQEKEPRRQD